MKRFEVLLLVILLFGVQLPARAETDFNMSEEFNYTAAEGTLITDAAAAPSGAVTALPDYKSPAGWGMAYPTTAEDSGVDGMRFKSVLAPDPKDAANTVLKSYRQYPRADYNFTRYVFDIKPSGGVTTQFDVYFAHEAEPQLYIFQLWGNFKTEGEPKRVQTAEVKVTFQNGVGRLSATYYEGEATVLREAALNIPKEEWVTLTLESDTYAKTMHVLVNHAYALENIPFYKTIGEGAAACLSLNDFQFNSYRTYGGSLFYMDHLKIVPTEAWRTANQPLLAAEAALAFSDFSNEPQNAVTSDLNLSLAAYDSRLVKTYTADRPDVLAIDGTIGHIHAPETDTEVLLTVRLALDDSSYFVEKNFLIIVLGKTENRGVNAAYDMLTEDILTHEPLSAVSQPFSLAPASLSLPEGVTVSWQTDNPAVLSVDAVTQTALPHRGETNQSVVLTATIQQEGPAFSRTKSFAVTVLAKRLSVLYADSFYEPTETELQQSERYGATGPSDAGSLWETPGWNFKEVNTSRFSAKLTAEDERHFLSVSRSEAYTYDYNFLRCRPEQTAAHNVTVSANLRFRHNAENPDQLYQIQIYGCSNAKRVMLTELRFEFQKYSSIVSCGAIRNEKQIPVNSWIPVELALDLESETCTVYINDCVLGTTVLQNAEDTVLFHDVQFAIYRSYAGGIMDVDDMLMITDAEPYGSFSLTSGGKVIGGVEEAESSEITGCVTLIRCANQSVTTIAAVYDNGKLFHLKLYQKTPDRDSFYFETDVLTLPPNRETASVVFYLLDDLKTLRPLTAKTAIARRYPNMCEPQSVTDTITGRSYKVMDFCGESAIKSYYTMQSFNRDGTCFYFYTPSADIFEYNTQTGHIRFIDHGIYEHNLYVTQQNHLYYLNADKEIICMDLADYTKRFIAAVPPEVSSRVTMLQLTEDESELSVYWTADTLPNVEPDTFTFPVLNIKTGEWDYESYHYRFDTEQYQPNHNTINPWNGKLMFFAHEGDDVGDRIWMLDRTKPQEEAFYNVFVQKPYNDYQTGEKSSHEGWMAGGERILFVKHGGVMCIGHPGLVSVGTDGQNRRYINNDYSYLHTSGNPKDSRWAVADTSYNGKTTDIVLVDCESGRSYHLAQVPQNGENPGHSHPEFSQDGKTVFFSLYDEAFSTVRLAWMDVSDILDNPVSGGRIILSDSCESFSYAGQDSELKSVHTADEEGYLIAKNKKMYIDVQNVSMECASAKLKIRYYDDGRALQLFYYIWQTAPEKNELKPMMCSLPVNGSYTWKTAEIELSDINLENMEWLGSDFYIAAPNGGILQNVECELQ